MFAAQLVILSGQTSQSKGIVERRLWKMPEQSPVIRYVHVFLGIDVNFETCRSKGSDVWQMFA